MGPEDGHCPQVPRPSVGWPHVLIVNMAGFEGTGDPDGGHCHEILFGSQSVGPEARSDPDTEIIGLFDAKNDRPGALALQERIDIVAFVVEEADVDDDDEIRRTDIPAREPRTNGRALASAWPMAVSASRRDPLYRSRWAHNPVLQRTGLAPRR